MILIQPSQVGLLPPNTPATFSALMDLYECNYIQIRRLLPVMPPASATRVSQPPDGLDLHAQILKCSRYTSELTLTYQFDQEDGRRIAEPNLRIRVYHDARQAEVLAAHPRHYPIFTADGLDHSLANGAALFSRWRTNRFLYKWLSYCLRQGHRFRS
jgi:uncharacterized protein